MGKESKKLPPSRDLFCGAVAGTIARLFVAPLDLLKIRFQIQAETNGLYNYKHLVSAFRKIVATEGTKALWKGNVPALLMVIPYSSLQLSAFYQFQQTQIVSREPYASLALGSVSSAIASVSTYPLDLLRTRLAAQTEPRQYETMRHAVTVIYSREGAKGLYAGLQPTLLAIVPYMSFQFAVYEGAKQRVLKKTFTQKLRPQDSFAIGAIAGTTSKLVTLPLDNAKKIMQVEGQFQANRTMGYRSIFAVLTRIWKRDGWRGWFRGALPSVLKAAPNSAITFSVYEGMKRLMM